MAGRSDSGGKVECPTCGARSNKDDFGRDGSPRYAGMVTQPLLADAESVRRRARAARIRRQNGSR